MSESKLMLSNKLMLCLTQVEARVLPPPRLQYERDLVPSGSGAWDLRGIRFFVPMELPSYGIAAFADRRRCGRGPDDPGSLDVCVPYH